MIWLMRRVRSLSLRKQLVLGVALVHAVTIALLTIGVALGQRDFLGRLAADHARALVESLAVSSASWMMANDLVGMGEVVSSVASERSVRYAMLLSPDGRVLAHSTGAHVGQHVTDATSLSLLGQPPGVITLVDDADAIDLAAPVMAGSRFLGWARVGKGHEHISQNIVDLQRRAGILGIVGLVLGALAAGLFAAWLTRDLHALSNALSRLGARERGFRLSVHADDEIGQLRAGFNRMLAQIEAQEAENERVARELHARATTDDLTGLDNRRHFIARLHEETARLQRNEGERASVLMCDLDHFKRVNDTWGHAAGDQVLKHFAQLLRQALRKVDSAGRVGGEEFAVLLPGASAHDAFAFAERLRSHVEQNPAVFENEPIGITVSIGIAELDARTAQGDKALKHADRALYRAKSGGRNRICLFAPDDLPPASS